MWSKIIVGVITALSLAFAGYIIYEVYIKYLTLSKAKAIVKEKIKKDFKNKIERVLITRLDRGTHKVAKINLYDNASKKVAEINIKTDHLDNDLSEGDLLIN